MKKEELVTKVEEKIGCEYLFATRVAWLTTKQLTEILKAETPEEVEKFRKLIKNETEIERNAGNSTGNPGSLENNGDGGSRDTTRSGDSDNKLEARPKTNGDIRRNNQGVILKGRTNIGTFIFSKGRDTTEAVKDIKTMARLSGITVTSLWRREELGWIKI